MPVENIPVTILNDPELIDLGGRIAGAITRTLPDHVWFKPLADDLQLQIQGMNRSRARQAGSDLTDNIGDADAARDKAFLTFRAGLEYFQLKDNPAQQAAAENLLALVRTREYSLQNLGDREQSVELNALLGDLAETSAVADVTTLGLTAEVTAMTQTQQAFNDFVNQRAAESDDDIPSLPVVRALLREDLAVARNDLAFAERLDAASLGGLAEEISSHITDVVATARARRTREQGGNDASSPPPPETP